MTGVAGMLETTPSTTELVIEFSATVVSIEAVKRAAYAMMDRASVVFDVTAETIVCRIQPVMKNADPNLLDRDFRREALDQDLRMTIEARTDSVRSAILGLAFSRTGLQDG